MNRGAFWAVVVYLVQIPVLVGCVVGLIPLHPIVIMLPLVVLFNAKVEGRGREGLGLTVVRPGNVLLLALLFGALSFGGDLIVLWREGVPLRPPALTVETIWSMAGDFAVDVFIIALWEEVVSRGYIQTRLQTAWGFLGVIVATLLFASLHIPSAFLDYSRDLPTVLFRFMQTGLSGFMLGYLYLWTASVPTTIALHGLRNFALSLILRLSGLTASQMLVSQKPFQLLWLVGQLALMLFACPLLFKSNRGSPLSA